MIETDDIHSILTGQLENIPALPANVVKIFICANPKEFDVERKFLWHEVLPDLQQHCLQYGLDVLFIDMLHGNYADAACNTRDLRARVHEIEDCHAESVGPFFLGLLGDQYGDVPLPFSLSEHEFRCLLDAGKTQTRRSDLLRKWYRLDDNAIPPAYVLRNEFYLNSPEDSLAIYKDLLEVIQTLALACDSQGKLSQSKEKYFTSGLERQIKQALWLSSDDALFVFRCFFPELDQPNGADEVRADSTKKSKRDYQNLPKPEYSRISKLKEDILDKVPKSNVLHVKISCQREDFQENKKSMTRTLTTLLRLSQEE